jgi:hypothetical protein
MTELNLVPIGEAAASARFPGLTRRTLDRWIAAGTIGRYAAPEGAQGLARTYVNVREVELAIRLARMGPRRPWRRG